MTSAKANSSRVALALATGVAFTVLIGLGLWQVQRGAEKEAFLGAIAAAASQSPVEIWQDAKPFQRVRLSGYYDQDRTVYVRVTSDEGLGVYVMTPLLQRAPQRLVYVNRGFVRTGIDGKAKGIETPTGLITVIGFKRDPEPRGAFVLADEPQNRLFALRDPVAFAALFDLPVNSGAELASLQVEASYVEAELSAGPPPNGISVAQLRARIPNNHFQYALTWFGIASTLAGVYGVLAWRMRKPVGNT
jgi:surfeit locus 1 family protein